MAIKLYQGKTKFMWFPVTGSTAIAEDRLVLFDSYPGVSNGRLIGATAGSQGNLIMGVLRHAIVSTDDDFATAGRLVEVEVPIEKNVVWECDVTTAAALTTTDMGQFHDLSTNGNEFVTGNSTYDHGYVVGFISATKGLYILNIGPESLGVATD